MTGMPASKPSLILINWERTQKAAIIMQGVEETKGERDGAQPDNVMSPRHVV